MKMFVQAIALDYFKNQLNKIAGDLEYCGLDNNAKEVVAVVAGYVTKYLMNKFHGVGCQILFTTSGPQQRSSEVD